ncbi:hypothetical protein NDU88_006652, partial [Pleurodeles waltl]
DRARVIADFVKVLLKDCMRSTRVRRIWSLFSQSIGLFGTRISNPKGWLRNFHQGTFLRGKEGSLCPPLIWTGWPSQMLQVKSLQTVRGSKMESPTSSSERSPRLGRSGA